VDGERRVHDGEIDDGLLSFVETTSDYYFELNYRITRVVGRAADSAPEIARIVAYENENMAKRNNIIDSYTLVRKDTLSTWRPSTGLDIDPATDTIDAFVIEEETPSMLVLTDREGFFLSRDGGANWEDFNHGEAALLNGSRLRPVVTGKPEGIYVLSLNTDGETAEGNNELLRYVRRS
jgi:hypothetical protein